MNIISALAVTAVLTSGAPAAVGPGQVTLVGQKKPVPVAVFELDAAPVTNAAFAAFVAEHPVWRRGAVSSLFAEGRYLHHWRAPATPHAADAQAPVVFVSWFAARAYCAAQGKRLPTTAEWELAAMASPTAHDATTDKEHQAEVLGWYARPTPQHLANVASGVANAWGVFDLNTLVWEWVEDFQSAMVADDAREGGGLRFCGGGGAGAADAADYTRYMRYAYRAALDGRFTTSGLGFRCARTLSAPAPITSTATRTP